MGQGVVKALSGVRLGVGSGEFAALVGSFGSGKSTFLNLIAGIHEPTACQVILVGRDLGGLSEQALPEERGRTVGIVFSGLQSHPGLDGRGEHGVAPGICRDPSCGAQEATKRVVEHPWPPVVAAPSARRTFRRVKYNAPPWPTGQNCSLPMNLPETWVALQHTRSCSCWLI